MAGDKEIDAEHFEEKKFVCFKCNRHYPTWHDLQKHLYNEEHLYRIGFDPTNETDRLTKEGGLPRNPEGKPEWDLVDWKSLEPMVRVLMHGAKKYAPDNWKKGYPIRRTFSSLMRHMAAFMDGEDIDPESGESHLGHAMCNILFMQYMLDNKPEYDDRDKSK